MTDVLVQHEIDRMLDDIDGELTTHSRVVDALLDLRSAGTVNELFVLAVDDALTTIPGRTAVANTWWMEKLEALRNILDSPIEASTLGASLTP